jgi:hypothetical protein
MISQWRSHLQALPEKDRTRIQLLGLVFIGILLWFGNIAPAWKAYQEAPLQLAQLEKQTESLKALQAQAIPLQKAPRIKVQDATALLQQSTTEILGNGAKLNLEATRATLTLTSVSAEGLAQFWQPQEHKRTPCPLKPNCKKPRRVHKRFGVAL